MKKLLLLFSVSLIFIYNSKAKDLDAPIIIDHNCADLTEIPSEWIIKAKQNLKLSYGHTSHGSQLVTGLQRTLSNNGDLYDYKTISGLGESCSVDELSLLDRYPSGDLGNPDRTTWEQRTRDMIANDNFDRNVIMWSWCGQVNGSESEIQTYLDLMDGLEKDFPELTFVYMTGHLDGSGEEGNVNQRNNQIREFCKNNNKILFDFADIESYDPDGNYFLDKDADDGCNYNGGNWAEEWCEAHPGECDDCSCAHSHCLNCQQKGKAFWYLLARIAGWETTTKVETWESDNKTTVYPNPAASQSKLSFKINEPGNASIKISDIFGNPVYKSENVLFNSGESVFQFEASGLSSGVYIYYIRIENKIKSGRFVIYQ